MKRIVQVIKKDDIYRFQRLVSKKGISLGRLNWYCACDDNCINFNPIDYRDYKDMLEIIESL